VYSGTTTGTGRPRSGGPARVALRGYGVRTLTMMLARSVAVVTP
jgi:hypothetical protein